MTIKTQTEKEVSESESLQFLTFLLANEEYGVNILDVQEIKSWESVTRIPNTRSYMLGVINLRGTIVPIIDLRQLFGFEPVEFGITTVVIVLTIVTEGRERTVGMVVDAVSEVRNVRLNEINPSPELASIDTQSVRGLVTIEDRMLILLDMNTAMESALHDVLDESLTATG